MMQPDAAGRELRVAIFASARDLDTTLRDTVLQLLDDAFSSVPKTIGIVLSYGGGSKGLMGRVRQLFVEKIAPGRSFRLRSIYSRQLASEQYLRDSQANVPMEQVMFCDDAVERTREITNSADIVCCLPGAFGTLEEISITLSSRKNDAEALRKSEAQQPFIVFVDVAEFWKPLAQLFSNFVTFGSMKAVYRDGMCFVDAPDALQDVLRLVLSRPLHNALTTGPSPQPTRHRLNTLCLNVVVPTVARRSLHDALNSIRAAIECAHRRLPCKPKVTLLVARDKMPKGEPLDDDDHVHHAIRHSEIAQHVDSYRVVRNWRTKGLAGNVNSAVHSLVAITQTPLEEHHHDAWLLPPSLMTTIPGRRTTCAKCAPALANTAPRDGSPLESSAETPVIRSLANLAG